MTDKIIRTFFDINEEDDKLQGSQISSKFVQNLKILFKIKSKIFYNFFAKFV